MKKSPVVLSVHVPIFFAVFFFLCFINEFVFLVRETNTSPALVLQLTFSEP